MYSKYNEVGDYAKAIPTNDQWEQQQKKKKERKNFEITLTRLRIWFYGKVYTAKRYSW